ncbi:MAG: ArnT family glycosyltransferase [Anaerolineae bacterium]
MYPSKTEKRVDFVFILITLVAFGLRTAWPTLAEFKYDEANVVRHALQIAYEGALPVIGVSSSTGVRNLPLTLYLMALPLRFWADPVAAVIFTGWLNGLAVVITYRLGKRYFDLTTGRVAAALFAVGGWAVLYGRKIWCRTLPLFTLVFITSLLAWGVKKRPWALVGAFAALAGLVGLQLEGLVFGPILGLTLLLFHRRIAWRPLLLGLGLFTLLMAPYVVYDAQHGWANARGLLRYAGGTATFSWTALTYAFRLTGSDGIAGMAGAFAETYLTALPDLWWLNRVVVGLLILALGHALLQVIRGTPRRRRIFAILLLWFGVPVLSQLRTSSPTQPHYFVVLYPVQFLLIGALLSDARRWVASRPWRRLSGAVLLGGLLLWSGWQIANVAMLFSMMVNHPSTGGYGVPLHYTRAAAALVAPSRCPGEVIVLSESATPAFDETPAVFDALLPRRQRRFADGRLALPVPAGETVAYLVGPDTSQTSPFDPLLDRLEIMTDTARTTLFLPDGRRYLSFCRRHADRGDVLQGLNRLPADVPFANAVVLTAYALPTAVAPGESAEIWIAWWLRETPPSPEITQFYAHLRDEQRRTWAQFDGNGYPASRWRAGDLVVSRLPITLPEEMPSGRYTVRVGMYTLPDVVNVPVVDVTGTPVDDGVTLGHLTVRKP